MLKKVFFVFVMSAISLQIFADTAQIKTSDGEVYVIENAYFYNKAANRIFRSVQFYKDLESWDIFANVEFEKIDTMTVSLGESRKFPVQVRLKNGKTFSAYLSAETNGNFVFSGKDSDLGIDIEIPNHKITWYKFF